MDPAAARFLARIGACFGHDLRAELGTTINLAATVEVVAGADPVAACDAARKIRDHAQDVAGMWKSIADALELAGREPRVARGDPSALTRAIATECGVDFDAAPISPSGEPAPTDAVECDPALFAFVVHAFLELLKSVPPRRPIRVRQSLRRDGSAAVVEIRSGDASRVLAEPAAPPQEFLRRDGSCTARIWRTALFVADALVELEGGALELLGDLRRDVALRFRLPPRP